MVWRSRLLCAIAVAGLVTGGEITPLTRTVVSARSLLVDGTFLYVGGDDRVSVYDVSSPGTPAKLSHLQIASRVLSMALNGEFLVLGLEQDIGDNILIVDCSDRASLSILSGNRVGDEYDPFGSVAESDGYLLAGVGHDLHVLFVDDGAEHVLVPVSSLDLGAQIEDIEVADGTVYVGLWGKIAVVDMSAPGTPFVVRERDTDDFNLGLAIAGSQLLSAEGFEGVKLYDITPEFALQTALTVKPIEFNEVLDVAFADGIICAALARESPANGGIRLFSAATGAEFGRNTDVAGAFAVAAGQAVVYVAEGESMATFGLGETELLQLISGWNLISVPFLPSSPQVSELFGETASGSLYAWEHAEDGTAAYGTPAAVAPLIGYWIRSHARAEVALYRMAGDPGNAPTLYPGWNLVGVTRRSRLPDHPDVVAPAWGWDQGPNGPAYRRVTDLEPKQGYWVFWGGSETTTLEFPESD